VLGLPEASDPCDWFATETSDAFDAHLSEHGRSTVPFLCSRELEALRDANHPQRFELVAQRVTEACRSLVDPLDRDSAARQVSQACGVSRNVLAQLLSRKARTRSSSGSEFADREPIDVDAIASAALSHETVLTEIPLIPAVRAQFVLIAALADADQFVRAREIVQRARAAGQLAQPDVQALLKVADSFGTGRGQGAPIGDGASASEQSPEMHSSLPMTPIDVSEWIERARQVHPPLAGLLDAAIHQDPRQATLMEFDVAADLIEEIVKQAAQAEELHETLRRGDLADNPQLLEVIQLSMQARKRGKRKQDATDSSSDVPPLGASDHFAAGGTTHATGVEGETPSTEDPNQSNKPGGASHAPDASAWPDPLPDPEYPQSHPPEVDSW